MPARRPASFAASADDPPDLTATPGEAGDQLDALAEEAVEQGIARLAELVRAGDRTGGGSVLGPAGRKELADELAAVLATADLLARVRVLRLADDHARAVRFDDSVPTVPTSGLTIRSPEDALRYFLGLEPRLGVDPDRWGESLRRRAFTLAASTDEQLTAKVQAYIADALRQGRSTRQAAADVDAVLDAAGVGPRQSGYGTMVMRTAAMTSYTEAATEQLQDPDIEGMFPVWQYVGINDGRQGKDHEPKFDRYYPSSVSFAEVRGPRVFNCRCSFTPIARGRWEKLQAAGARVETAW